MSLNKVSVTMETLKRDIEELEAKKKIALTLFKLTKKDETDAKCVKKTLDEDKKKLDNRRKKLEADERKHETAFNQVEERINRVEIVIKDREHQLNALVTEVETKSKILREKTDKDQEKKKRIEAIEAHQRRLEAEKKRLEETDDEEEGIRVKTFTFEGAKSFFK